MNDKGVVTSCPTCKKNLNIEIRDVGIIYLYYGAETVRFFKTQPISIQKRLINFAMKDLKRIIISKQ